MFLNYFVILLPSCLAFEYKGGFVQSPARHELLNVHGLRATEIFSSLPESVDWRSDRNGNNIATKLRNQHIPHYCGACWSFAASSALSDRVNIVSGRIRQTGLSMQVILNCDMYDGGCHGGDPLTAYQFIHEAGGIPDETCQSYTAEGHDTGKECREMDVCMDCNEAGCFAKDEYPVWTVDEYGLVNGTDAMLAELQRGPIACSIAVTEDFFTLRDFSIYKDESGDTELDHSISVVGYGSEAGKDYWIIRNSWGSYWGENGFARIARGVNNLGIESNCQFAVPANNGAPIMRKVNVPVPTVALNSSCRRDKNEWKILHTELSPSAALFDDENLPESYDIRNLTGVQSFWTIDKNQHAPAYCGSCWAEAVTSALSDRLALANKGVWPPINLSPQVLINCKHGGDCQGGSPALAYSSMRRFGVPDETCQAYSARNSDTCDEMHVCEECFAGETPETFWPGTCHRVSTYNMYYVAEYGKVSGAEAMKTEIWKRGPITCGLFANSAFVNFRGNGVFQADAPNRTDINHEVAVSGWGRDSEGEFWIVRNSWGTAWGDFGWFRIRMHHQNLNIESDCSWAVPTTVKPGEDVNTDLPEAMTT